jgi:hypothetical protein
MKEVGDSSVTPPDFGAAFGGMSIAGMGEVAVVSVTQISKDFLLLFRSTGSI